MSKETWGKLSCSDKDFKIEHEFISNRSKSLKASICSLLSIQRVAIDMEEYAGDPPSSHEKME